MRRFFRLVKHNPPVLDDFKSNLALGKEPRNPSADLLRRWDAISVTATEELARELFRLHGPRLGRFIADFEVDERDMRNVEEDADMPGHFELWCDAEPCLRGLRAIIEL